MKISRRQTWVWVSFAALTLGSVLITASVKRAAPAGKPQRERNAARRANSNPFAAFERSSTGPVKRNEPVGWVFGRMVGVNASTMTTFKSASVPPLSAVRPGGLPQNNGGPR